MLGVLIRSASAVILMGKIAGKLSDSLSFLKWNDFYAPASDDAGGI